MDWIAVNDKIVFQIQEIKENKLFSDDDLGNLRKGIVKSIGEKVVEVHSGASILLAFQDITHLGNGLGVCSERNVISVDSKPIHYKLEVKVLPKDSDFDKMMIGEIIKTPLNSNGDFKIGDKIKFKPNTYMVLPNNNLLLSEDKVFLKIG